MPSNDDVDSGRETISTGDSLESTPKKPEKMSNSSLDDDDEEDETLIERLCGLSEMFPEGLRNITSFLVNASHKSVTSLYGFSRNALWIFFSSATILMAPVIFELERVQMEQAQLQQQRQILLGPNVAISGGSPGIPALGMPMSPIPPPNYQQPR